MSMQSELRMHRHHQTESAKAIFQQSLNHEDLNVSTTNKINIEFIQNYICWILVHRHESMKSVKAKLTFACLHLTKRRTQRAQLVDQAGSKEEIKFILSCLELLQSDVSWQPRPRICWYQLWRLACGIITFEWIIFYFRTKYFLE